MGGPRQAQRPRWSSRAGEQALQCADGLRTALGQAGRGRTGSRLRADDTHGIIMSTTTARAGVLPPNLRCFLLLQDRRIEVNRLRLRLGLIAAQHGHGACLSARPSRTWRAR